MGGTEDDIHQITMLDGILQRSLQQQAELKRQLTARRMELWRGRSLCALWGLRTKR